MSLLLILRSFRAYSMVYTVWQASPETGVTVQEIKLLFRIYFLICKVTEVIIDLLVVTPV